MESITRNMDIDILRAFLTIHETGSFSIAAARLGRTQSTVSQQIKRLEDILGHNVLHRTNRAVHLSAHGEMLLPYARRIIDMNDEVFGRISSTATKDVIRMGVPESFALHFLPDLMKNFEKAYPNVMLEVECGLASPMKQRFEKGQFDLVVYKANIDKSVAGEVLAEEPVVWVASEPKVFHKNDIVPLIASPYPCGFRSDAVSALDEKGFNWQVCYSGACMTGRIAMARAGVGVTMLPKFIADETSGVTVLTDSGLPALPNLKVALLQSAERTGKALDSLGQMLREALSETVSEPVKVRA